MQSKAESVSEYLSELPADRKKVMQSLRNAIRKNLPKGFEECMNYGMIGYVVPHKLYPQGYHCNPEHPLPFMGLASQKGHISVYHMGMYEGDLVNWFNKEWKLYSTKKLDMGRSCIRFKNPDDVPIDLIGKLSAKLTVKEWIDIYEREIKKSNKGK